MIIRISGGKSGITDYLEHGVKNGRGLSRNELDKRVNLSGDLQTIDTVLSSFDLEQKADKYLHITLSFKENAISPEILQKIDTEFKDFLFTAYNQDEFAYYAEAHLPRIKSYTDLQGEQIDRKPHIHVVIPEINLQTGKKENPLGFIQFNTKYINAFQEYINQKYELESPKNNIRNISETRETIINRYKFNEKLNRTQFKEKILKITQENNITSQKQLVDILIKANCEARVVKSEKTVNYINFKAPHLKKGINLKDYAFSEEGLNKSQSTKPRTKNNHNLLLDEWREKKAFEVKYIWKKTKSLREKYKSLSDLEKINFLQEFAKKPQEKNTIQRISEHIDIELPYTEKPKNLDEIPHLEDMPDIEQIPTLEEIPHYGENQELLSDMQQSISYGDSSTRNSIYTDILQSNEGDDLVGTGQEQHAELHGLFSRRYARPVLEKTEWVDTINKIDCRDMLNYCGFIYGLDADKYTVGKNKLGLDRIKVEKRFYSASDFLTKHMHLSWTNAKSILNQTIARQESTPERYSQTKGASKELWREFKKSTQKRPAFQELVETVKLKRKRIHDTHRYKYDRNKTYLQNQAQINVLKARKAFLLEEISNSFTTQMRENKQTPSERYIDFLQVNAQKGRLEALSELRRVSPYTSAEKPEKHLQIQSKRPTKALNLEKIGLEYRISNNGKVFFEKDNKTLFIDAEKEIQVIDRSEASLQMALILARAKYNTNRLEITGITKQEKPVLERVVRASGVSLSNLKDQGIER